MMKLLEAVAKVGDTSGCMDLFLKNDHIREVQANSILSLGNCHVRIKKKRLVVETDDFS